MRSSVAEPPPTWGECHVCAAPIGAEPLPGGYLIWAGRQGYFACARHLARTRSMVGITTYTEAL